jgi:hypothetical protein
MWMNDWKSENGAVDICFSSPQAHGQGSTWEYVHPGPQVNAHTTQMYVFWRGPVYKIHLQFLFIY